MNSTGNTIYLTESSNSEKPDTYAKESKYFGKPFPFFSHTLFYVIKRTAKAVTVFCDNTVFYSEETFGKFGCHAEKGSDNHPKKSTRSTCTNSSCNADDITGSNRRA